MRLVLATLLAGTAVPAMAQDHSGHAMPAPAPMAQTECDREAARHRAMGHTVPEGACAPASEPADATTGDQAAEHKGMDHSQMDHSAMDHAGMERPAAQQAPMEGMDHLQMDHSTMQGMDHSQMDHSQMQGMDHGAMEMSSIPEGPPPAAAGSGPPRAADAIWGADAMRESREQLRAEQGAQKFAVFRADRFEYRMRDGQDGYLWDLDAWYGGDLDKLWLKSEGEGAFGEDIEQAEVQALYSRAIGPWWDVQAGVRQDLNGPTRTYAVLGIQGLARYVFEVDAAAFLSDAGDLTGRIEAEIDQRITQRLILQPRGEVNLAAQDIPELGIGAGIDSLELGVRLRYEFVREFAPYVGVEQEWKLSGSADYARANGEDPSVTSYVLGLRFWF